MHHRTITRKSNDRFHVFGTHKSTKRLAGRLASFLGTALILALVTPALAQNSDVIFKKDVKQYIAKGDKAEDVDATLTFTAETLVVASKRGTVEIPLTSITSGTYDRRTRQRKFMGLPAGGHGMVPKLQHFLTVQYKTRAGGGFLELELGKDIAGRVVATLEAKSGKTIEKITG